MIAAFYHTDDQKQVILHQHNRLVSDRAGRIFTRILPASNFHPAEEYHQKYFLQKDPPLMKLLRERYPDRKPLLDSTVAARLNAYRAGHITREKLRTALSAIDDLTPEIREKILNRISDLRDR